MGVVLSALDFKKAEKYYGEYSAYNKYGYGKSGYYGGYGETYGAVPPSPDMDKKPDSA